MYRQVQKAVKTKDSLLKGTNKAVKTVSAEGSKTTGTKDLSDLTARGLLVGLYQFRV